MSMKDTRRLSSKNVSIDRAKTYRSSHVNTGNLKTNLEIDAIQCCQVFVNVSANKRFSLCKNKYFLYSAHQKNNDTYICQT